MTDTSTLLADMMSLKEWDIPDMRRDTSKLANVRWLQRNLGIQNRDKSLFPEALRLLRAQAKMLTKTQTS